MLSTLRSTTQFNDVLQREQGRRCVSARRNLDTVEMDEEAPVPIPERTNALVRGLDLVLAHHGAPKAIRSALSEQLHGYLDTSCDETVWLKCAKHTLAYPLSKYLRNEPPTPPAAVFKPTGHLRAWLRQRLTVFSRKNTHLWYSWLQAKRCALPASESIVKKTYEDHYTALSTPDSGDDETIREIFADETFQRLLTSVRKDMTELLRDGKAFESRSPSTSACFEQTRGAGGQLEELLYSVGMQDPAFYGSELYRMVYLPRSCGKTTLFGVLKEIRYVPTTQWTKLRDLKSQWDVWGRPINCTIQAVLEPMKVRVISKGEALPYYTMAPLQKALHTAMRHRPCFRLIGRPFSPCDVLDCAEKAQSDYEWFSVDYSAATDGLSWKYSGSIFRYLIGNLPKEEYNLAMRVLGPHNLFYPEKEGLKMTKVFRGIMRNGQLMGSILSFPILCLANLGVYLKVSRPFQRDWSDEERLKHVLINGDDMLYAAPRYLWEEHARVSGKVGLKMSVGKAYHHRAYANVNSTSVQMDLSAKYVQGKTNTPYQIPYLNAGLFYGEHKVQGGSESKETETDLYCRVADDSTLRERFAQAHMKADPSRGLVCNLNILLGGSLPGRQGQLLTQFFEYHDPKALQRECTIAVKRRGHLSLVTRNIFLPCSVGGMGVVPPCDWKFKVTDTQKWLAGSFLRRIDLPVTTQRPSCGYDLADAPEDVPCPFVKPATETNVSSISVGKAVKVPRRALVNGVLHYVPQGIQWCNRKYEFESVADRFLPDEAYHCVQQW